MDSILSIGRRFFFAALIFLMAAVFAEAQADGEAAGGTEGTVGIEGADDTEGAVGIEAADETEEDGADGEADENGEDEEGVNANLPITTDWGVMPLSGYTRGDQTFNISLGVLLPLFFTANSGGTLDNKLLVGGVGSLAYNYFLDPRFFIGGILQGSFAQTIGKNFLYLIPIGVTVGYQVVLNRFEFPFSLTAGGMTQQYLTYNGYWPFLKPQASGFFRFNSDWSFGLNAAWWIVPQWTNTPDRDAAGNFLELTLAARYHF